MFDRTDNNNRTIQFQPLPWYIVVCSFVQPFKMLSILCAQLKNLFVTSTVNILIMFKEICRDGMELLLEINTTPSDSIGVMIILFKVVVRMDKKDLYITQNSYPLARNNIYTKPKICYKNPPSRKSCPELFEDNKQMQQILTKNNYSHPPDSYIPMPHAIETECKKTIHVQQNTWSV